MHIKVGTMQAGGAAWPQYYVIVISRARGMYGIYCTETRGRKAARGLSAIKGHTSRVHVI